MPRPLPKPTSRPIAYGLLLFTMVIWASAFAGLRFVLRELDPWTMTLLRMLIATGALVGFGVLLKTPLPSRQDLPEVLGAGLLGFTLYHLALNYGLEFVTAGQGAFIISTIPIWTTLLAGKFLDETISARTWAGLILGLAGVAYMSLEPGKLSISHGSFVVLFAAMCAGGNIILQKRLLRRYRALDVSIYACVVGTVPLLVFLPGGWQAIEGLSATGWWVIAYLGVVPIALGYFLSTVALNALPANRTSQMLLLIPPIAAVIAWLTIGEEPGTKLWVGGPLILVGVLLGNWERKTNAQRGGRRERGEK
jgi:drug/metabolite transporter (DMT)-like permease